MSSFDPKLFVSNILSENASLKKYFGAIFKMGYTVEESLKNRERGKTS